MIISGIDIPNKIVSAIKDHELVVFAGAGISKDEPAGLPGFEELAHEIARVTKVPYKGKEETGEIDEYLGDLERKGVDVKKYITEILSAKNSKPNPFHFNIINLFKSPNDIRIITTNQDELFEAAIDELGYDFCEVYNAPALPYGNDFTGIVHLHGRNSKPDHIIVTDTDFGKAYMLNGFASRFLVDVFKKYTVLFIGYSYNDRIVRYLTTAITAENITNAYLLTDKADQQRKRTRIQVITYGEGLHKRASAALQKLGQFTKRSVFEWEQQIISLNNGEPPIEEETRDELLAGIKQLSVQKRLCAIINGDKWPEWLDDYGVFDALFTERGEWTEIANNWADWLASNYIQDKIFALIKRHQGHLNEQFCMIVLEKFNNLDSLYTDKLFQTYLSLMVDSIKNGYSYYSLIRIARKRKLEKTVWLLFWKMLEFDIVIDKRFFERERNEHPRLRHEWIVSGDIIKAIWDKGVLNCEKQEAQALSNGLSMLEELYVRLGDNNTFKLDHLNIEEKGGQLFTNKTERVICEIVETAFKYDITNNPEHALGTMYTMLDSHASLVQRIGLMVLRKHANKAPQDKLLLVLNKFSLHDIQLREQVFKLIADCFDQVGNQLQQEIIRKIWDVDCRELTFKSEEEQSRYIFYARYNWLQWIKKTCKGTNEIDEKLEIIKKHYPKFKTRERPELTIWSSDAQWGDESPVSFDQLHTLEAQDAYDYITSFKEDIWTIGPSKAGLTQTLEEVCKEDFDWAVSFWELLVKVKDWSDYLWGAVTRGVANAVGTTKEFFKVIALIENEEVYKHQVSFISSFLDKWLSTNVIRGFLTNHSIQRLARLVKKMWEYRSTSREKEGNWVNRSLNSSTGDLCNAMLKLALMQTDEKSLPAWFRSFIVTRIEKETNKEEYACVICEYASHLFNVDERWTRQHVISLLSISQQKTRQAAWEGFLVGTRNFYPSFAVVLLPIFKSNIDMIGKLDDEFKKSFVYDYALLIMCIAENPIEDYLSELIAIEDEAACVRFANSVKHLLRNMLPEERSRIWNTWLKEYWELRNKNIPKKLSAAEFEEMLGWLIGLPEYKEAIDVAIQSNVKGIITCKFPWDLKNSDELQLFPEQSVKLVEYLIKNSDRNRANPELNDIVEELKAKDISQQHKIKLEEIYD